MQGSFTLFIIHQKTTNYKRQLAEYVERSYSRSSKGRTEGFRRPRARCPEISNTFWNKWTYWWTWQ